MDDKTNLPVTISIASDELIPAQNKQQTNIYLHAATSENTRKAYRSDIRHYENWGGHLPASSREIIQYLEDHAQILNPRTLSRRIIALKHWHVYQEFSDPTSHASVMKTLAGITRIHGSPKNKARPLTPEELTIIAKKLRASSTLSAARDNALLQVGFLGALRRSELVAICVDHIKWNAKGIEILLPFSKTDQTHEGQYCAIPKGNDDICAVSVLQHWLNLSKITEGPIFRSINQFGMLSPNQLSPLSVNIILKERAAEAGIMDAHEFSSHSLRRGLATSAANAGAPLQTIMRHGRWKQVNTVIEYIEASERFAENAASHVLSTLEEKTRS